jgi:hypothetical protein
MVDDKIDDDIKMYLWRGLFQRPCGCAGLCSVHCLILMQHVQGC